MMNSNIFITLLCIALGVIAFIEILRLLPVTKYVHALIEDSRKALIVVRSKKISDHWKEKVIPRYARHIMASSFLITSCLVVLFLTFSIVYGLVGLQFNGNLTDIIEPFYQIQTQLFAIVFGILYALLRKKIAVSRANKNIDYTLSSKTLHYVALSNSTIKEMAFDIDCIAAGFHSSAFQIKPPVYIAGLARAGTTILLEALYSTGVFTTLTYRDMPFVTAPYLWSKITKRHKLKEGQKKERAHGDQLYVSYDSPEAFEEVFWMTFSNAAFVKNAYLELQDVKSELLEKYVKFVGNIVARHGKDHPLRYLAKNNNNLIRINAIKSAFPDSIIIAPFRNPIDHSKSLLSQHERFLERNNNDPFSLKYMNWLGHYEFGANFKPFNFNPEALPEYREEPKRLDYWLRYWKNVYEYLIEYNAKDVMFFDYDKLCEKPDTYLNRMEGELSIAENSLKAFSNKIRPAKKYMQIPEKMVMSDPIRHIYDRLKQLSL